MLALVVSSGGKHCMAMMPRLKKSHQGRLVTVGLDGAVAAAVDLGRRTRKLSQVGKVE